jgi:hypothetical protein
MVVESVDTMPDRNSAADVRYYYYSANKDMKGYQSCFTLLP